MNDLSSPEERRNYIAAVIGHRCSDVLSEDELGGLITGAEGMFVPIGVVGHILDVLDAFGERLASLEGLLDAPPRNGRRSELRFGFGGSPVEAGADEYSVRPIRVEIVGNPDTPSRRPK